MLKTAIAEQLLDIKAVYLRPNDPFTWSSGIKSPIYCDNRLTLSYPHLRGEIAEGLKNLIDTYYPEAELIAGTATAGIPHAAWVSSLMDLPMCYVRSKPKEHGKGNQIEGRAVPGQKAVVVEDLISTGGSAIKAAEALRNAGCEVLGIVSIFTYELEQGRTRLAEAGLTAVSLSDYSSLIKAAADKGIIEDSDVYKLNEWRKDPSSQSWMKA